MVTVRLFRPDEWPLYKAVRLRALQSDPDVFGSNHAREAAYDDDKWRQDLLQDGLGVFGVFEGESLIGMTGIYIKKDDPSTAGLWGSWLERDYRAKGVSRAMYVVRLDWARARPGLARIVVSHRESNEASRRANQKQGFAFTHREDHVWRDGTSEPELFYELRL